MPDAAASQHTNPRWTIYAAVAVVLIGLTTMAYYGLFRPGESSAPQSAETPPPVASADIPSAASSAPENRTSSTTAAPATSPKASPPAQPATVQTPAAHATLPVPDSPAPATQSLPPVIAQAAAPVSGAPASSVGNGSAAAPGTHRASLKISSMNWVSACSDGQPAFAKLLMAGDARDIDFQRTATVRLGNAGAAEIYLDGKSLGSLGTPGSVKVLEISATGIRAVGGGSSPEADCQAAPPPVAAKP